MYIIHTSDLHLVPKGVHGTILERCYYEVLHEIAEITIEKNAKYLLISGDFLDRPDVSSHVMVQIVKALKKLRDKDVKTIVVPGNHDNPRLGPIFLNVLNEADLIHLLEYEEVSGWLVLKPRAFSEDKIAFYGIPGFRGTSSKEVVYLKNGTVKFAGLGDLRGYDLVILAHINTKFAGYNPSMYSKRYGHLYLEYEDALKRLPENTIYVALGHVHLPLPLEDSFRGNIAYPGAPIGYGRDDFLETYQLIKLNKYRRVLGVDLSMKPPMVDSIRLEKSPGVQFLEIQASSVEEAKDQVNKAIRSIDTEKDKIILINIHGLTRVTNDILVHRQDLMRKYNIYIDLRAIPPGGAVFEPETLASIPLMVTEGSIDELEEQVLRSISEKEKRLPYDRLRSIIELLSTEGIDPKEIYNKLVNGSREQ